MKRLCGVGGAHVDRRGRVSTAFVAGASNPGIMREDAGGGVFNALRAACARGVAATLVSVRGGDGAGEFVGHAVDGAGVDDVSAIFLDRRTASYTAILDEKGDVAAALADMGVYEACFARALRRKPAQAAIRGADAVLTDANPPADALAAIAAIATGPLHAIAVSPAKAVRYRGLFGKLATLFMNRREMAALTGLPADAAAMAATAALRALGLSRGVVTDGPRPLFAFDGDAVFALTPPAADAIADVTGAGDALAGAAVAAMLDGRPFGEALREGVAASVLKLTSEHAAAAFDDRTFAAALDRVPRPLLLTETA